MAVLRKSVFVRDPDSHRTLLLSAGEEPAPRLAALVTNPDAWEDGKLPDTDDETASETGETDTGKDSDDSEDTAKKAAPAAKKTAAKRAASSRSRGRDAADQGDSGA